MSQISDVRCSEHRHGHAHASKCTDGRLAYPAAENTRKNPRPPEKSKPEKKVIFYMRRIYIKDFSASAVAQSQESPKSKYIKCQ